MSVGAEETAKGKEGEVGQHSDGRLRERGHGVSFWFPPLLLPPPAECHFRC